MKLLEAAYLKLPGISGNFASTPDNNALDVTGDIDIRVQAAANNWANGAEQDFVTKWLGPTNLSYIFAINATGTLLLAWTEGGTGATLRSASSSVATGFVNGTTHWLRATLDVDDGGGNRVINFFTSEDGVTWTQLGTTTTTAGTTSIHSGTDDVEIGTNTGGTANRFAGKIYRAQVRNGIDGTLVADFDPSRFIPNVLRATMATGEEWAVSRSGQSSFAEIVHARFEKNVARRKNVILRHVVEHDGETRYFPTQAQAIAFLKSKAEVAVKRAKVSGLTKVDTSFAPIPRTLVPEVSPIPEFVVSGGKELERMATVINFHLVSALSNPMEDDDEDIARLLAA